MNLFEYYNQDHIRDQVIISKHPEYDLYLIRYNSLGVDWEDEKIRMARGLVIDDQGNIVSRPYSKFFNYLELENREVSEELKELSRWNKDEDYLVMSKLDGSLIQVFKYKEELIFTSSGSFVSEHAEYAKRLYYSLFDIRQQRHLEHVLDLGHTLLFEMTTPRYQIVIDYKDEALTLHGVIDIENGELKNPALSKNWADLNSIPFVQILPKETLTLENLLEVQENSKDIEGYVLYFPESKKLMKIKVESYLLAHHVFSTYQNYPYTKRSIETAIDMITNGQEDDLVANINQRKPEQAEFTKQLIKEFRNKEQTVERYHKLWSENKLDGRTISLIEELDENLKNLIFASKFGLNDRIYSFINKMLVEQMLCKEEVEYEE